MDDIIIIIKRAHCPSEKTNNGVNQFLEKWNGESNIEPKHNIEQQSIFLAPYFIFRYFKHL